MDDRVTAPGWRKSSYTTSNGGNCVEVAGQDSRVLVRDTKDRQGPVLAFSLETWRQFAGKVKTDARSV